MSLTEHILYNFNLNTRNCAEKVHSWELTRIFNLP